jgi:hypothetical protein
MSLKAQLKEFDVSRKRPPEVMAIIRRGIEHVKESGAAGLRIGESGDHTATWSWQLWRRNYP